MVKSNHKVYVGLSGGVDSSVSATLLKGQGYDVTGVFIKVWQPDFLDCNIEEDRLDAMRVCAYLEIPFVEMDFSKEYKKEVVDYMIAEYKKGRTPNPDVMCNKYVKFGAFFNEAMRLGADFVATGHYAQILPTSKLSRLNLDNRGGLTEGVDPEKDQSYFLWTLTQAQLQKTIFPVGGYKKSEVRKLAKKFNLPTAEKKDSQGLCFIGKLDMKEFLKHFINEKGGKVLDISGEIVGKHDGATFYTIGQRHGFNITKKTTNDRPMYVVSKDIENNTILVSEKEILKKESGVKEAILSNVNWTSVDMPDIKKWYEARIRYRGEKNKGKIAVDGREFKFVFEIPTIAPAGQSLVIYDREMCLGGGVIN